MDLRLRIHLIKQYCAYMFEFYAKNFRKRPIFTASITEGLLAVSSDAFV